jgi:hypothetical protein
MAKIVTVVIDEGTGATEIDAAGYHGKGCDAVIKGFAAGLGSAEVTKKAEFNKPELTKNKIQIRT